MALADDISDELEKAIGASPNEVQTVRTFLNNLKGLRTPSGFFLQTAFIHMKPYAYFVTPPTYSNRRRCELGDILWVFKTISGGMVTDHRGIFSQVKRSNSFMFRIERHQYDFLLNIKTNSFRFGKVYSSAGYQPKIFTAITSSDHFSNYLFIGGFSPPRCDSTTNLVRATYS
jgi:hypothetical protein